MAYVSLSQLLSHLEQNNLWHVFQSAYRRHHCTKTALLRGFNDLLNTSDSGQISVSTLLGLGASFRYNRSLYLIQKSQECVWNSGNSISVLWIVHDGEYKPLCPWLWFWSLVSPYYTCTPGFCSRSCSFILYTQPWCEVTNNHSVLHHMFADDTDLYKWVDGSDINSLFIAMRYCVSDVKNCQPQFSEQPPCYVLLSADIPASLQIGQPCVHFADSARNLGVIFDSCLSMRQQMSNVC